MEDGPGKRVEAPNAAVRCRLKAGSRPKLAAEHGAYKEQCRLPQFSKDIGSSEGLRVFRLEH